MGFESILNAAVIVVLAALAVGLAVRFFRTPSGKIDEVIDEDTMLLKNVLAAVKSEIDRILQEDVAEMRLNETETRKRIKQKAVLRDAVRTCCLGDIGKRIYIKEYIKTLLQDYGINESNLSRVIPFDDPMALSAETKFLLIYAELSKTHGNKAYGALCDGEVDDEKEKQDGVHYEINEEDIERVYRKICKRMAYQDEFEVLAQVVYQTLYGLDVIDVIISDDSIDGCSVGVGGIAELEYNYLEEMMVRGQTRNNCYDSIFVMYHGRQIRQSFMTLGSKERLTRVVKNIYRYDAPEMLTAQNGYVVASRQDNARVTVARPPASASWAFFLRKFKSTKYDLESLLKGGAVEARNTEYVIAFLQLMLAAGETFTVSGSPASGKTTLLKGLVPYIDPRLTIRVAESVFETMFNVLMPERNIQVMQERGKTKISDIINAFKRMDTDITILGEITEPEMAGAFIQIAQSGGKMTMCTLHHQTTEKLIEYIRNGLMVFYDLKDSLIAEQQVVSVLNFDVHMARDESGSRYIERITEVVPMEMPVYRTYSNVDMAAVEYYRFQASMSLWKPYYCKNVVVYNTAENRYEMGDGMSRIGYERMMSKLSSDIKDDLAYFAKDGEVA